QGPLPPAAGRSEEGAERVRLARAGARLPAGRPRVPHARRRVLGGFPRVLHRAEERRAHPVPHDDAPGGIRHVLRVLTSLFSALLLILLSFRAWMPGSCCWPSRLAR